MMTLFNSASIRDVLRSRNDMLRGRVDALGEGLIESMVEEHIRVILNKCMLRVPKLNQEILVESYEEVRNHKSQQKIVFDVPFTGDKELLAFSPWLGQHSELPSRPVGEIFDDHVSFHITGSSLRPEDVLKGMLDTVDALEKYLSLLDEQCAQWNADLEDRVRELVKDRQGVLDRQRKVMDYLVSRWPQEGLKVRLKDHAA